MKVLRVRSSLVGRVLQSTENREWADQVGQQAWEASSSARKMRKKKFLQFKKKKKKKKEALRHWPMRTGSLISFFGRGESHREEHTSTPQSLLHGDAENSPLGVIIYGASSFLRVILILTACLFCADQDSTLFPGCLFAQPGHLACCMGSQQSDCISLATYPWVSGKGQTG